MILSFRTVGLALALLLSIGGCSIQDAESSRDAGSSSVCEGSNPGTTLEPLVVSTSSGVTSYPYTLWALESGCFAAHGLDVTVESSSSAAFQKIASLTGGTVDIGIDGIVELTDFSANSTGNLGLVIISHGYGFSEEQLERAKSGQLIDGNLALETVLLGQPGKDWLKLSDLAGRSVALNSAGNNATGLRIAMEQAGMDLGMTEFVDLGTAERAVAFERGDVDFVLLSGQQAREQLDRGATLVLYPGAYVYLPGSVLSYFTTSSILEQKNEEIMAFQRAMTEVNMWLSDPRNIETYRAFLVEELEYDSDVAEDFVMPNFSLGTPSNELIANYGEALFRSGVIPSPSVGGLSAWAPE